MSGLVRSKSQTLLTGVYRSGTEFVSLLMSGHPELSSTMYHVNVPRFIKDQFKNLQDGEQLEAAVDETAERLEKRYDIILDKAQIITSCQTYPELNWAEFYDIVMSSLWLDNETCHWAEKCQLSWRIIPEFLEFMPNGKAILVIRDPRSILASFKHYTYVPPPAYLGAIFNCYDALTLALDYKKNLSVDKFLVVKYEDAAQNPEETSHAVYRFLGLDPSKAIFDPKHWMDANGAPWMANSSFHENTSGFDIEAAVNRWKHSLSSDEIALTETVCKNVMNAWGYEVSGNEPDWPEMLKLFISDHTITQYFSDWLIKNIGIEAFPSDPLKEENWEENNPQEKISSENG